MVKNYSSPHCHSRFSDGRNSPEEMVASALQKGFLSIGFSDHAIQDFDKDYSMLPEKEAKYIAEILRLKAAYKDKISVYLGIERDYFSNADRAKFEYTIASVHYLDVDGQKVAVDGDKQKLYSFVKTHFKGDGISFAKEYYRLVGDYISAYKPDIIGHFDLLTKHNRRSEIFDANSDAYKRIALDALEKAHSGCKLLEINTGAIARSGASVPYPAPFILEHWHKLGGDLIISSDCHNAEFLDVGFDLAISLAKAAGFEQLKILSAKQTDFLFDTIEI